MDHPKVYARTFNESGLLADRQLAPIACAPHPQRGARVPHMRPCGGRNRSTGLHRSPGARAAGRGIWPLHRNGLVRAAARRQPPGAPRGVVDGPWRLDRYRVGLRAADMHVDGPAGLLAPRCQARPERSVRRWRPSNPRERARTRDEGVMNVHRRGGRSGGSHP